MRTVKPERPRPCLLVPDARFAPNHRDERRKPITLEEAMIEDGRWRDYVAYREPRRTSRWSPS